MQIDFFGQPSIAEWYFELLCVKTVKGRIKGADQFVRQADSINAKTFLCNGGIFLQYVTDNGKTLVVIGRDGARASAAHQIDDKVLPGRSHQNNPLDDGDRFL